MKIEINLDDYIDGAERADIAREAFTNAVTKDAERILCNAAYRVVWDSFNDVAGAELKETLRQNVVRVINELSSYNVFQRKDRWDKGDSQGQIMLDELVKENRDILDARVREILRGIDADDFKDRISDIISETMLDALNAKDD